MIFAWNSSDPSIMNDWFYHGPNNRFQKRTLLLNFKDEDIEKQGTLPRDVFTATLRFSNVNIDASLTFIFNI